MKTVNLIASLLTVLLFSTALTACAEENKENAQQNAVQILAATEKEPVGDDGGRAEREQEIRENEERAAEQERQRQEAEQRQQEQQPSGGYEHQIGDAVFYTERDLWQYIIPDPDDPSYLLLDLEAMLHDVWGDIGMLQTGDGYAGSNGSSFNLAVSYNYVGENHKTKNGYDEKSYYFIVSTTGERQHETDVTIYHEKRPDSNWIVVKGDTFGFSPDSAALLLYVLEQTQSNPRSNIAGELPLPSNYECR